MPLPTINPTYNRLVSAVRKKLEGSDLAISSTGPRQAPDEIDLTNGTWANGISKSSRLLIQLFLEGSEWKARFPLQDEIGRYTHLGAPNNKMGKIAVHGVRIVVVVEQGNGEYVWAQEWEWLAFFVFSPPLVDASTSALLKYFRAETQQFAVHLETTGKDAIFAVREVILVSLPAQPGVGLSVGGGGTTSSISYNEASTALVGLFDAGRLPSTQEKASSAAANVVATSAPAPTASGSASALGKAASDAFGEPGLSGHSTAGDSTVEIPSSTSGASDQLAGEAP